MMEIKSQFVSTVSHELRTPLACIKESLGILLDGNTGKINSHQQQFLEVMQRNINRLSTGTAAIPGSNIILQKTRTTFFIMPGAAPAAAASNMTMDFTATCLPF